MIAPAEAIPGNAGVLDQDNPWPGLEGYAFGDEQLFKGRNRETSELFRLIKTEQLSVLYGKSGYGKSSLLRAGLAPELRRAHFVPIYLILKHDERAAGLVQQVRDEINRVIDQREIDAPKLGPNESLWEYFHRKEVEWWDKENNPLTPVLIFDQFEEVITVGQESAVRQGRADEFLTGLENLVEHHMPDSVADRLEKNPVEAEQFDNYGGNFKVVLALREDFLPELESLRGRLKGIMTNRYRLLPMNGQQALQVVLKPAPDLVDEPVAIEIVDRVSRLRGEARAPKAIDRKEIAKRSVEPALLSMLCSQLNRKRRELGLRKISPDLVGEAQVDAVLHEFYDRGMGLVPENLRKFVERRLITSSGARNRCDRLDLLAENGIRNEDIETLIRTRILRQESSGDVDWIELTHDRLAEIAKANRDEDAVQRENQKKLAEAEAREQEALRRLKRSKRRTRLVLAGSIVALALVIGAGALFESWHAAELKTKAAERAREKDLADKALLEKQVGRAQEILDRLVAQTGVSAMADSVGGSEKGEGTPAQTMSKVSVSVPELKSLLSIFSERTKGREQNVTREAVRVRAAEALLAYRAGEVDDTKALEASAAELEKLRESAPDDADLAGRTVDVRFAIGDLLKGNLGPRSENQAAIAAARAQYESAGSVITQFLGKAPNDPNWLVRQADLTDLLGDLLKVQSKVEAARAEFQKARQIREQVLQIDPSKAVELNLAIARGCNKVGNSHYRDNPVKAIQSYEEARDRLSRITISPENDIHWDDIEELRGIAWGNIGNAKAKLPRSDWTAIQNAFRQEVVAFEKLYRSNRANTRWRNHLARACLDEASYNAVEVPPQFQHPKVAIWSAMEAIVLDDQKDAGDLIPLRQAFLKFEDPAFRHTLNKDLKDQIDDWKRQNPDWRGKD